jgi:hypothetical protein
MYITGTLGDFESRLHQNAVDTSSLTSFTNEGNVYLGSGTGIVSPQMSGKWEKEARKRKFSFTQNPNDLVNFIFFGANSDNFNRADGALGSNWFTPIASEVPLVISGSGITPSAPDHHSYAVWTGTPINNNQYSQVQQLNVGPWNGMIFRSQTGVDAFYMGFVFGANDYRFYLRTPGNYFNLKTMTTPTWSAGDVMEMEVYDNGPVRMYFKRNGVYVAEHLEWSTIITGGQPGIGIYSPSGSNLQIDNWSGGNVNVSIPSVTGDNFQRADCAILGLNWINSDFSSAYGFAISGNRAVGAKVDGVNNISLWSYPTSNQNHWSQITISSGQTNGDYIGCVVRAAILCYEVIIFNGLPTNTTQLYMISGLTSTQLATSASGTWAVGDVCRMEASGANPVTITIKQNGTPILIFSDSTYLLTGNMIGACYYQSDVNFIPAISNWSGGLL